MAVEPTTTHRSPIQLDDTDGANSSALIIATGDPDGAADPMASAGKSAIYFNADESDDEMGIWAKVDEADADDDWVRVLLANCSTAVDINGDWEWQTDTGIFFRDAGQFIYSPAANTAALALAASGDTWRIGDMASSNYLYVDFQGELHCTGTAKINSRDVFEIFDDFTYRAIAETYTPWILNSGTDPQAIDPAISAAEGGVLLMTTGDDTGATAVDATQIICHIPVQADSGGLVFETRLHINTAITNVSVFCGLTDVTTLEEPFTNAADVITSNATDACGFLYDTDATTDEWWMCAVDSDTDDSGNAATGTAPVADTYQVFRVEVSSNGNSIAYYIDGTLEGTLTNVGVTETANLYATVIACGDGTASKTVDVDYIYVGTQR